MIECSGNVTVHLSHFSFLYVVALNWASTPLLGETPRKFNSKLQAFKHVLDLVQFTSSTGFEILAN